MSQQGNSQPSSLVGTCLTLPNLGFLWVFFKYPKISKTGNLLFFPVIVNDVFLYFYFSDSFLEKLYKEPAVRVPSLSQLSEIAKGLGLDIEESELMAYRGGFLSSYV